MGEGPRLRVLSWLAALALVALAVGLPPIVLARATSVRLMILATHPGEAPRSLAVLLERGESIRRDVDPIGPGEPPIALRVMGLTDSEVSHLADVRRVFSTALTLTIVALVALAAAVGRAGRESEWPVLRAAALRALIFTASAAAVAVIAGAWAFDALFTAFHQLFFASGTWTFPADSALIQTFPEPFWMLAGALWAVLAVALEAGFWLAARALESRTRDAAAPAR